MTCAKVRKKANVTEKWTEWCIEKNYISGDLRKGLQNIKCSILPSGQKLKFDLQNGEKMTNYFPKEPQLVLIRLRKKV